MGEALLVKAGTGLKSDPLDDVPVTASYCSILAVVRDSGGNALPNAAIHCKDGNTWYNYNTNEKGMVVFSTSSGAANIIAWNYSILDSYNIIDQMPSTINIDAPIGTKLQTNINLIKNTTNPLIVSTTGNYRISTIGAANIKILGGGAGGQTATSGNGNGGGGGAYNQSLSLAINRTTTYAITIGNGGAMNWGTGGTTSAFGISAVGGSNNNGGGSGTYRGGNGGINNSFTGSTPNYSSLLGLNYGGGGAKCININYIESYREDYMGSKLYWTDWYLNFRNANTTTATYGGGHGYSLNECSFSYSPEADNVYVQNTKWQYYNNIIFNDGAYGSGGCGGYTYTRNAVNNISYHAYGPHAGKGGSGAVFVFW